MGEVSINLEFQIIRLVQGTSIYAPFVTVRRIDTHETIPDPLFGGWSFGAKQQPGGTQYKAFCCRPKELAFCTSSTSASAAMGFFSPR